jgi:hypothetical protein
MTKMKQNEHIEHQYKSEGDHPEELNEEKMDRVIQHRHKFLERDKDTIR